MRLNRIGAPSSWLARLGLVLACGCGEQEIRAIASLPTPSGGPTEPDPRPTRERGRVQVRDGRLVTDEGTLLRGVTWRIDSAQPVALDEPLYAELSAKTGLNALHVYVENSSLVAGARAALADELVERSADAGLYVVLGMGAGDNAGTFDLEKVRAFWTFYAARYASRTHVIFELLNVPTFGCESPWGAETMAKEKEVYGLIRQLAPSTHVALFSFNSPPAAAEMQVNLDALQSVVDWSNASVAFHPHDCAGEDTVPELIDLTRAQGIAAFASELDYRDSIVGTKPFEAASVSWFNLEWLTSSRDLSSFRDGHSAAEISWCPDFGEWPEDSGSCRTP